MQTQMQTQPEQINSNSATFSDIEKWLKHEYEHLGWMALALSHKHYEKPYAFAMSLQRMMTDIDAKLLVPEIKTNFMMIADLTKMKHKLQVLIESANSLGINTALKDKICSTQTIIAGGKKKRTKKTTKKRTKKNTKKRT